MFTDYIQIDNCVINTVFNGCSKNASPTGTGTVQNKKKGLGTTANSPAQRYDKLRFLLNFAVNLQSKFKFFVPIPQISQDISGIISLSAKWVHSKCGYNVGTFHPLTKRKTHSEVILNGLVVEIVGVEPTTPCLQSRCSSQLSYTPRIFKNL